MRSYRADVDGLRTIAVLLVLVFHFDLFSMGKAGFVGVDVFFVISGFLITSIIRRELDLAKFSLKTFYLRRIRRLAPALFSTLILVSLTGLVWLLPSDLQKLSEQILSSQFYVANIYFWKNVSYFGLQSHDVYLLHTWSLAVEEQFYLIYPVVLLLVYRYIKPTFWWFLGLSALASFALNIAFVEIKPEATFYLLPTRAWELLIGGLIPLVNLHIKRTRLVNEVLGAVGLILIACSIFLFDKNTIFPGFFALLPTLGAALCILCGESNNATLTKLLSLRPIVYIGNISYPLYLVHWPINVFAQQYYANHYDFTARFSMFVLSFFLAASIYHFIENPIRHRKIISRENVMIGGYTLGVCASVAFFAIVFILKGIPNRFSDKAIHYANAVNDKPVLPKECREETVKDKNKKYCVIGDRTKTVTWIITGDSHALAGFSIFDKWLKANGIAAYFTYLHQCVPLNDIFIAGMKSRCFQHNTEVMNFIQNESDIKNVFLISTWLQASEGRISNHANLFLGSEQSVNLFTQAFRQTIEKLQHMNKSVVIWEPVPGGKTHVPRALARRETGWEVDELEFSIDEYHQKFDFFFMALAEVTRNGAKSFSPSISLCAPDGICKVEINNTPVYQDTAHLAANNLVWFWEKELQNQLRTDFSE